MPTSILVRVDQVIEQHLLAPAHESVLAQSWHAGDGRHILLTSVRLLLLLDVPTNVSYCAIYSLNHGLYGIAWFQAALA